LIGAGKCFTGQPVAGFILTADVQVAAAKVIWPAIRAKEDELLVGINKGVKLIVFGVDIFGQAFGLVKSAIYIGFANYNVFAAFAIMPSTVKYRLPLRVILG
jgi:hypothetical protein